MPKVLIVHHMVSPPLQDLFEAVSGGFNEAAGEIGLHLEVDAKPTLTASAIDVVTADAVILGTPATIGYMSGGPSSIGAISNGYGWRFASLG